MKVLLTIAGLGPENGGPSQTVPALARGLAGLGVEVELISCESRGRRTEDRGQGAPILLRHKNRTTLWLPRFNDFSKTLAHLANGSPLPSDGKGINGDDQGGAAGLSTINHQLSTNIILHDTGLWLPTNHAVAWSARRLNRPLLVSPRGMLTSWALQFQGLKKRIAWFLYQQRDLQTARVLHATSFSEAEDFRRAGLTQPIAVVPNGVELPSGQGDRRKQIADRKFRTPARTVLFVGRIHPVKGLMNLVKAWGAFQQEVRSSKLEDRKNQTPNSYLLSPVPWRLVIAGNDENGHLAELKEECRREKIEGSVEFVGPIDGEAKWKLYRSADLFVLPSHSENFGLVVPEALASGVPVITTKGTPWQELQTHRCGWWVDVGAEPLLGALRRAMSVPDEERREMGKRGRALIESKYTWPKVAEQMKSVYEWMLGLGPKPECVQRA